MSERSIQLRTQLVLPDANASVDSEGWPIIAHGLSQAEKHVKHKPRFAEFACSHTEVSVYYQALIVPLLKLYKIYRYAALITKAVIPKAFWGSDRNFKLVLGRTSLHMAELFAANRRLR
jgi:hypothetical protein